jgi:hypothetical protein
MKGISAETAVASVWGLNISSYLIAALPFLQVTSLVLAITISLVTLYKLSKKKDNE